MFGRDRHLLLSARLALHYRRRRSRLDCLVRAVSCPTAARRIAGGQEECVRPTQRAEHVVGSGHPDFPAVPRP